MLKFKDREVDSEQNAVPSAFFNVIEIQLPLCSIIFIPRQSEMNKIKPKYSAVGSFPNLNGKMVQPLNIFPRTLLYKLSKQGTNLKPCNLRAIRLFNV